MKINAFLTALWSLSSSALLALSPGDLAFTGFNADGTDNLAFVVLADIPANTVIYFTDNQWNGTGFLNQNEAFWSWTNPAITPAGTVIRLDNLSTASIATNFGTATFGTSPSKGLAESNEAVFAYLGSNESTPTTFLGAIGNDSVASSALSLTGTGLTNGTNCLFISGDEDIMAYTGLRDGSEAFFDYQAAIFTEFNWETEDVVDSHNNGTPPDVPFDLTPFTLGAVEAIVQIETPDSVTEGDSGTKLLSFTVSRDNNTSEFSVDYAVTGGTAVSGSDYTSLTPDTLTFTAGGPSTQTIDVEVIGDTVIEGNETVTITLSNLDEIIGTTTFGTTVGSGTITNDDVVPVTFPPSGSLVATLLGSLPLAGSEIPAFDPLSKRAFASSGVGIQVIDLTNPGSPTLITTIAPAALGVVGLTSNDVSSVTVRKGGGGNPSVLAAAIINAPKTANGHVVFLNAATGALLGSAEVGSVPDHIAFSPDGTRLLVCNEGELDGTAAVISADTIQGTVSILDVTNVASPVVTTADFTSYDAPATITSLKASGVRIFAGGKPSTDFEPEYLAISPDGTKAMVTLQEANAVATLDIATATFTAVVPLGEKDFSTGRHDFSDRDAAGGATGIVNPTTGSPVFGLYMPDAIASYQVGGQTYYITANEGDDRNDFLNPDETTTVSNAGYDLDNTVFPNESALKMNGGLGRLAVSNASGLRGDTDNDGDIDRVLSFGGRSFSILNSAGVKVFDSGDMIEMIVASQFLAQFDDGRSDNKGPEPEGVTVAKIGTRTFAFVGLERSGLVLAFDVTNPLAPTFATGIRRSGDANPEGLVVVPATDSPNGKTLLLVSNEGSNTLSIFQINPSSGFESWLNTNGFASLGFGVDSDGDGLNDGLEYFFNQNPNNGADFVNLTKVSQANGDKILTFTTNDGATDVTGVLECSLDLGDADPWRAAVEGVDYEVAGSSTSGGETTTTLKLLGAATAKFFRHGVTKN
jgi:hypothetical protein